jgi:hypothetical protein
MRRLFALVPTVILLGLFAIVPLCRAEPTDVQFNRDIRPILSDTCFACHGPDANKREGDLRLDLESEALSDRGGSPVIVPGEPDRSELLRRVFSTDPDEVMPPADSSKSLSPRQKELLRAWIAQGAQWQKHWSLIPPQRPALPDVAGTDWAQNAIDRFILRGLEQQQQRPSPDADKRTLMRRLYFDVIGLPPTPEQVDAFLTDESPQAYEKVVDQLLASKHYGERMAVYWLDVVRYADTAGYHSDNHRDLWPYRDYVIQAFNDNKPFDQFIVEQLAGDLLPEASRAQKIASGYNRLLQTTEEGGAQAREYTAKYAADRVRNTGVIWLGLTMGCCECHDHKYDPLTARDFYSFEAFFADIQEVPVGRQAQTPVPTEQQQQELADLDARLARLREELVKPTDELAASQQTWETEAAARIAEAAKTWSPVAPQSAVSQGKAELTVLDDQSVLASGENPDKDTYVVVLETQGERITGLRLEALTHESLANKSLSRANGNFVLSEIELSAVPVEGEPQKLKLSAAEADFSQDGFPVANAIDGKADTGWAVQGHVDVKNRTAVFALAEPLAVTPGLKLSVHLRHESSYARHNLGRFRLSLTSVHKPTLSGAADVPAEIATILNVERPQRSEQQRDTLLRHYRSIAPQLEPLRKDIAATDQRREALVQSFPATLVSTSVAPRTVRILPRGNWLDESGDIVQPATPQSLNPMTPVEARATRLDLARWMVADDNPLVARVFVNRLWKLCFAEGLVGSVEDFGTQGDWPTHPELLDWLAVEFRESEWNVKHVHKLILMSRAYQQSSQAAPELRERDPYNDLVGRQGRYRLDAEFVRDNALAIAGLMSTEVGGPSVKPYQPPGYWANLNFPKREWANDSGDATYRRGLYTYWCRSFLHPMMLAFDAPSREECVAQRPRSNTPLQALVLLNDPTFVEAARAFAARIVREGGADAEQRLRFAFRLALQRAPRAEESAALLALYQQHKQQFAADAAAAEALQKVGQVPAPDAMSAAELAAWTSVGRVILNLHETMTRY